MNQRDSSTPESRHSRLSFIGLALLIAAIGGCAVTTPESTTTPAAGTHGRNEPTPADALTDQPRPLSGDGQAEAPHPAAEPRTPTAESVKSAPAEAPSPTAGDTAATQAAEATATDDAIASPKTEKPADPGASSSLEQGDRNAAETVPESELTLASSPSRRLFGRVELDDSGARDQLYSTVIYYTPDQDFDPPRPRDDFVITTASKRFHPDVLPIPVGSSVRFPNGDPILHNVFSVSPVANFDLGLYPSGESRSFTFDEPGLVFVHCNVHHSMQADVLVLETPWYTKASEDGTFELRQVPEGTGRLVVWHPRSRGEAFAVAPNDADMGIVTLELTRPRVPLHTNKLGQPYRPERGNRR